MLDLTTESIRDAIFSSRDQLAALNMIVNEDASVFSYSRIVKNAELVQHGLVSYRVFWARYWIAISIACFILLVLLFWLRRLFFRPQIIIKEGKSTRAGTSALGLIVRDYDAALRC